MERRNFLSLVGLGAVALTVAPAAVRAEDFRKSKPTVWTAKSVDDAITAMYGKITPKEEGVTLTTPDVAANGGAIPVAVASDIDAKTVAIFQDVNPESAVAVYDLHEGGIVDYAIKIKMKASGTITVILEGRDGKFYSAKKTLEVALGGCEG